MIKSAIWLKLSNTLFKVCSRGSFSLCSNGSSKYRNELIEGNPGKLPAEYFFNANNMCLSDNIYAGLNSYSYSNMLLNYSVTLLDTFKILSPHLKLPICPINAFLYSLRNCEHSYQSRACFSVELLGRGRPYYLILGKGRRTW